MKETDNSVSESGEEKNGPLSITQAWEAMADDRPLPWPWPRWEEGPLVFSVRLPALPRPLLPPNFSTQLMPTPSLLSLFSITLRSMFVSFSISLFSLLQDEKVVAFPDINPSAYRWNSLPSFSSLTFFSLRVFHALI